jgi:hypothetical protein
MWSPVMTTSREQRPRSDGTVQTVIARLESQNAQLRQAVDSHAVVDQAVGVLIAVYGLEPAAGFEVLREVSQRTNTKLHTIAATLIGWALGDPLPAPVRQELESAAPVYARRRDVQDRDAQPPAQRP